jgi:hypothetical protein
MALTLQVLVAGLAAGGVYGIVAAGHSVVFRLTGVVNLAFGDLIGLGVFTTLLIAAGTGPVTQATAHGPRFLGALAVGLAVCVGAGALSYALAFQPVARGGAAGSPAPPGRSSRRRWSSRPRSAGRRATGCCCRRSPSRWGPARRCPGRALSSASSGFRSAPRAQSACWSRSTRGVLRPRSSRCSV